MPEPLNWVLAALVGAVVGSFLNVCVHRWPRDESVVAPRSRCPGCAAPIRWYENIPVASFVALGGRCRSCGAPISWQYPVVETATALIWAALALHYGISVEALRGAVFLTILLGIAVTDARHYLIPDEFSLGGLAVGLGFAALPAGLVSLNWLAGAAGLGFAVPVATVEITFLQAAVGAGVGFGLLWLVAALGTWIFRKPAMGGGDVKMLGMVGAFLGTSGVLLTVFLGALVGSLIFGPVSWRTGKLVPFGVFLAVGAAVAYGWGDLLVDWYTGRFLAGPPG